MTTVSSRNAISWRSAVAQAPTNGFTSGAAHAAARASKNRAKLRIAAIYSPMSQPVERAGEVEFAAAGALDLAARRLWQRARAQERDLLRHDVVLVDDRFADPPDEFGRRDPVALRAL